MKKPPDDLSLAYPDEAKDEPLLVASNITRLRAQRGWSLQMLATRAAIDEAELVRHLEGKAPPPLEVLWKIARALGVPVSTLLRPLRPGL